MSLLPTLLASTSGGGGSGGGGSVIGVILSPVVASSTATLIATYANGTSGIGATLTNGLTNLTAARVATTGALTVTQSGAGIGATLTNNGAQAAISIDSVALSVNDRVLVKNQAAPAQNGVYSVTTVGTGATNWVLTRVTDFDQAAEMVAGTEIGVTAGTTNTGTLWLLAATVTNPDTTACTFNATAAFTIDGQTPTVGQRVLIKNQSSALQNGIYTVTVAGSTTALWVLTRATDFNQPSQMTAGSLVVIINGAVNAATIEELTASVAAVGTNSVTFTTINIATALPAGTQFNTQSTTLTTAVSVSANTTPAIVTGLSVTITPTSASSKVLVRATVNINPSTNASFIGAYLANGSTPVGVSTAASGGINATSIAYGQGVGANDTNTITMEFLDSPATTSATTYNVYLVAGGAVTIDVNTTAGLIGANDITGSSTITACEVHS